MSIISIVLGILIKYNYLQLSSDFFKNPDILSWILIILGILSLIYSIYVTIVAFKIKDDIWVIKYHLFYIFLVDLN